MTMTSETYYLYVLIASNAVLLAIACVAVVRFERRWKRIEEFWDSPTGSALGESHDDEVRAQVIATKRLEKRLGELQRTVKIMDMKAPQQSPPAERNLPIENAVRMARSGASVEDLTRNCGLNFGEARLMQKLHGRASATARPH
jgi:hypothetical protein